ncbi:thioesterase family protein [Pseudooceanicola sp.]|uniref:thioesterase family protein n=1 Tax=Pseudooceanicola sp. TaxID=1914328 RepID=UPI00261F4C62|nr:thioesterase family protein [Pseudooceanicola sp.]MDF1855263.1 thioesterase family protein [Pseudooceanicola sp.]
MATIGEILADCTGTGMETRVMARPEWMQGRTLLGGLTALLQVHAAQRAFPDLPPLRSAQFAFSGPAVEELVFTCELLRRGKNSAVISVDCRSGETLAARALLTFAAPRPSTVVHDLKPAPQVIPPEEAPGFHRPGHTRASGFPENFELKRLGGRRPLEGGDCEIYIWSRLVDDSGIDPGLIPIALGDGLPPAAMVQLRDRAPVSTMTWSMDFFHPVAARGWHILRSVSEQAADGYSLQYTDIWDAEGRRVAVARQMVAVFG